MMEPRIKKRLRGFQRRDIGSGNPGAPIRLRTIDMIILHGPLCSHMLSKLEGITLTAATQRLQYAYAYSRCVDWDMRKCSFIQPKHRHYFWMRIA